MLREWFDEQLGRLSELKGQPKSSDSHFEALGDIPPDVLSAGVGHALKTRVWYPVPAELRADCDAAGTAPQASLPPRRTRPLETPRTLRIANPFGGKGITVHVTDVYEDDCTRCGDTGWAPLGNRVARCHCIETNPTIQRRRAARAKYSTAPEKVR